MVRRRLTLKRIDPWSVLKFGFVANLSLLLIGMLGFAVIWFFIERLRLIDQVCEIALELGFRSCGIDGGNLLRALFLLGLLGVVIMTGVFVFLAFLFNLIADLVGGLTFSFVDETPGAAARGDVPAQTGRTTGTLTQTRAGPGQQPQRIGPPPPLGSEPARREGAAPRDGQPARESQARRPSEAPRESQGRPQERPGSSASPSPAGAGSARRPDPTGERMWGDTPRSTPARPPDPDR